MRRLKDFLNEELRYPPAYWWGMLTSTRNWRLVLYIVIGPVLIVVLADRSSASNNDSNDPTRASVLLVQGAPGSEEYGKQFQKWAADWQQAAKKGNAEYIQIGPTTDDSTPHSRIQSKLDSLPKDTFKPLWLVIIGHGTFDGRVAKFNLEGPDVSASELAKWLKPFHRPLIVINAASASGPFIPTLSATNRVIVTATRSGYEHNFARFGRFFSNAISNSSSDLDRDGQTSVLEAFLQASKATEQFYTQDGRLQTEHALIDDTGDALGTPADWFQGIHPTKRPKSGKSLDGRRAHQFHLVPSQEERQLSPEQLAKRDELELKVYDLRQQKDALDEEEYYNRLETILVELARLYRAAGQRAED